MQFRGLNTGFCLLFSFLKQAIYPAALTGVIKVSCSPSGVMCVWKIGGTIGAIFFLSGLLDLDHRLADGGLVSHNEILQKNL